MIKRLYIKNLAIINEVHIDFEKGLNIITGQTGSGKSIIINAIDLLLGTKFNKNLIRSRETYCIVEGDFFLNFSSYIIRRVFYSSGKSKSFLNDKPVTLSEIKSISSGLIDFHGQHQHQKLLNIDSHIEYLDAYGSYKPELKEIQSIFQKINSITLELDVLVKKQKKSIEKKELYLFQLNELNSILLEKNIDKKTESEYKTLINAKEIKYCIQNFISSIDGNDNSILSILNYNQKQIDKFIDLNSNFMSFSSRLEQIIFELKDLIDETGNYKDSMDINENHIEKISEKFEFIEMLKRKYGGSIESAIEYKTIIQNFINDSTKYSTEIETLNLQLKKYKKTYFIKSNILTKRRKENAKKINFRILPILKKIGMKDTIINFDLITDLELINQFGMDRCIINISTNIGESLKPLNEIVSGGELSRIMLAIKVLMQGKDPVDTIIFDEVDSGVSGKIAESMGNLIESLGLKRQIVCITHLSQIACKGTYHLSIVKNNNNNKTNVSIEKLTKNKRILEIASLISGLEITANAKAQAEQLLLN